MSRRTIEPGERLARYPDAGLLGGGAVDPLAPAAIADRRAAIRHEARRLVLAHVGPLDVAAGIVGGVSGLAAAAAYFMGYGLTRPLRNRLRRHR